MNIQSELEKKVIIITGGAGLLGRSFSKAITEANGCAIVADRDKHTGNELVNSLTSVSGRGKAEFIEVDITSKSSIREMTNHLFSKYGKIDAVINCAYPKGPNYGKGYEDITYEDFCVNINLHLGGYFLVCQQLGIYFKKQGYGNIINISSIYGVLAPRFEIYEDTNMTVPIEYASIKSSIIHLTKYLAKFYKGNNIRVNCISPGGIFDNQPDIFLKKYNSLAMNKGMLNCDDLTGTLLYLLSSSSRFVNGQNIIVDDGWTL